jgi:hypothetical protein
MSLLTIPSVLARARRATNMNFSSEMLLESQMTKQASITHYDIFLSHSFDDKDIILGTTLILEDLGYAVYLDWRNDPQLNRKTVNATTASRLRDRMKSSKCLFYATTENSSSSRWMPWELGFKEGHNSRAAILPIQNSSSENFIGQEYLGLYPYVTQQRNTSNQERLWINRSVTCYVDFALWLDGQEPSQQNH